MSLGTAVALFALMGVLLWLVNAFVPMHHRIRILNAVVVVAMLTWLLQALGFIGLVFEILRRT